MKTTVDYGLKELEKVLPLMPDAYLTEELPKVNQKGDVCCPHCGRVAIPIGKKLYCDRCYKENSDIARRTVGISDDIAERKQIFLRDVLAPQLYEQMIMEGSVQDYDRV